MGFLDNSGDIILDAVLTDLGRKRLAEGNFTISQFALADDEINYALYNPNHASGSSYYDLEILQTPVLESFTNNTSTMKSRLITIGDNNILYLPILKESNRVSANSRHSTDTFLVAVDEKTQVTRQQDLSLPAAQQTGIGKNTGQQREGVLYGFNPDLADQYIEIHQGIDNLNKPKTIPLSDELREDAYIIQIDGRFGRILGISGLEISNTATRLTEDDDGFLFYTVTLNGGSKVVNTLDESSNSPIVGTRGTRVQFKIKASDNLTDNDAYFDRFGFTTTINSKSCKAIDSIVRVTGLNLGYSIDIPVRFVKDISS